MVTAAPDDCPFAPQKNAVWLLACVAAEINAALAPAAANPPVKILHDDLTDFTPGGTNSLVLRVTLRDGETHTITLTHCAVNSPLCTAPGCVARPTAVSGLNQRHCPRHLPTGVPTTPLPR